MSKSWPAFSLHLQEGPSRRAAPRLVGDGCGPDLKPRELSPIAA